MGPWAHPDLRWGDWGRWRLLCGGGLKPKPPTQLPRWHWDAVEGVGEGKKAARLPIRMSLSITQAPSAQPAR